MNEVILEDDPEDLFPTGDEMGKMLSECQQILNGAEAWRSSYETRWTRFYKLVHSFVERVAGDWGSAVFIPMIYTVIETIMPRILAQQPSPVILPVGPEDEEGAPFMEEMLRWSTEQSRLYLELLKVGYYALYYGTGILKTTPVENSVTRRVMTDVMEPVTSKVDEPLIDPETGLQMNGVDGQPMFETREVPMTDPMTGEPMLQPTGKRKSVEEKVTYYIGPKAEALSPFDLLVDPLCTGFEDAEYVVHRAWKSQSWVRDQLKSGYFRTVEGMDERAFVDAVENSSTVLTASRGMGAGTGSGLKDRRAEVHEFWFRDGRCVTLVNKGLIVRVVKSPYRHGQMPFVRIINKLNPGEFWGSGEVEQLEGLQDLLNAIWNQRVDNVRLKMNPPLLIDQNAVSDLRELTWGPGATISLDTRDRALNEVIDALDLGDVTSSAYREAEEVMAIIEKVSAVSGYATGTNSESLNDTATGIAIIAEQGNTRFSFKVKVAELTGYQDLFRQFGSLLQQFTPEDFVMRIIGTDGVTAFKQVEPAALYGAFDYQVEAQSSTQTETVRKQQAMDWFQLALSAVEPTTGQPIFNLSAAGEDLARSFDKKDLDRVLNRQQPMPPGAPPGMPQTGEEMAMGPMPQETML